MFLNNYAKISVCYQGFSQFSPMLTQLTELPGVPTVVRPLRGWSCHCSETFPKDPHLWLCPALQGWNTSVPWSMGLELPLL